MRGNAWVAAATFIAILLGTIIGGALIALPAGPAWAACLCIATAATGLIAAQFIPPAPAESQTPVDWRIWRATRTQLGAVLTNQALRGPALGVSWFWALGSVMLAEIPLIAARTLAADATVATLLLATFPIGLGLGALLAGRMHAPLRLLPFAALALTGFLIDFALASPASAGLWHSAAAMLADWRGLRLLADLLLAAIAAGGFVVPLNAALQSRSPPTSAPAPSPPTTCSTPPASFWPAPSPPRCPCLASTRPPSSPCSPSSTSARPGAGATRLTAHQPLGIKAKHPSPGEPAHAAAAHPRSRHPRRENRPCRGAHPRRRPPPPSA